MNWGNKLLVTFIVFGAGMSYLVYRSVTTNFELVDKDYYKNELRYQEVIDGVNRANALSEVVKLENTPDGLQLQLPPEMKGQTVTGAVQFYCEYDSRKDRKLELNTDSNGAQYWVEDQLVPGNYIARISWKSDGTDYYAEKPITIP